MSLFGLRVKRTGNFKNRQLVNSSSIGSDHITDGNCVILDRMDLAPGLDQGTLISENSGSECGGRGVNIFHSSKFDLRRNLTFHNGQTPRLSGEMYGDGENIVWSPPWPTRSGGRRSGR